MNILEDFFFNTGFGFATMILLVLGTVIGGVLFAGNAAGAYQCNNYAELTGKETRWVTLDTCYIKTERGWQRWDEYIARGIASEGLSK
jgi:hypothetical protein